jgi:hypothetical protein
VIKSYGGSPLSTPIGDNLVKAGVRLRSLYGTTEIGTPTLLLPNEATTEEWEWMKFWDATDVRWEAQGDSTFEAIFMVGGEISGEASYVRAMLNGYLIT